jgi:hypothetical protein
LQIFELFRAQERGFFDNFAGTLLLAAFLPARTTSMTMREIQRLQRRQTRPLWAAAAFITACAVVLLLLFGTGIPPQETQQRPEFAEKTAR